MTTTTAPSDDTGNDTNSTASTAQAAGAAGSQQLAGNFNTFLQLLTTQLQNQDPLSPLDTNQFTQQLVEFASVEQQVNMNTNMQTLISLQQTTEATSALQLSARPSRQRQHRDPVQCDRQPGDVELERRPRRRPPPSRSPARPARPPLPGTDRRSMPATRPTPGTAKAITASRGPTATTPSRSPPPAPTARRSPSRRRCKAPSARSMSARIRRRSPSADRATRSARSNRSTAAAASATALSSLNNDRQLNTHDHSPPVALLGAHRRARLDSIVKRGTAHPRRRLRRSPANWRPIVVAFA